MRALTAAALLLAGCALAVTPGEGRDARTPGATPPLEAGPRCARSSELRV